MNCAYCGSAEATTEDHVVPRGLFDVAPPEGHIKVPACVGCNNGYSRDEEYFLSVVAAEGAFYSSEPAERVWERRDRKHRSGKRLMTGLARRLMESVEPVGLSSPGGIYLGQQPAFRLEVERVNRVLRKMVRGLFFHELGRRLPALDRDLYVEIKPELAVLEQPPFAWVRSPLAPPAKRLGEVFVYRFIAVPDAPDSTLWLLAFYDSVLAVAISRVPPAGWVERLRPR